MSTMSAGLNHDAFERRMTTRDALVHQTCAMFEGLGYAVSAWDQDVYNRLDDAYDECSRNGCHPRFVIEQFLATFKSFPLQDSPVVIVAEIGSIINKIRAMG